MKIAVENKSTRVTNADAEKMTQAVAMQLAAHVAVMWERLPPSVAFYADDKDVPEDADLLILFDDSDQAGALGYHSEGPSGQPYGKIFASPVLDNGGGVLDGGSIGQSVASVLSHEAAEMFIDPSINSWYDGPTLEVGASYAAEVADPVEGNSYGIELTDGTSVLVSNFVGPSWFDEMAPADSLKDWMGICKQPFELAKGGYFVVRKGPGTEQEVFGEVAPPTWKIVGKHHPAARTSKRLQPEHRQ